MTQNAKLLFLIKYLLSENPQYQNIEIPTDKTERFRLFRSLVNIRPSKPISDDFLKVQDEYLQKETARKGITDIADLQSISRNIYLWKGNITALKCDTILNHTELYVVKNGTWLMHLRYRWSFVERSARHMNS